MKTFCNPILPGFYPDPSICRVDEDYYMVTSTFEYFPSVPIFHSKDLVNWRQIGHVIDRTSQINMDCFRSSAGIYAPTIRYNNGVFYMITTLVDKGGDYIYSRETHVDRGGNFIVTSSKPEGPWSDPYWLKGAPGIDPSLFFDDDGKVYFTGKRIPPSGERFQGNREIWLQEFDLNTMQLIGERYSLWDGACGGTQTEAGHIYKFNGAYYLMVSEGGTGHYHAVTIARSEDIKGPYISNPSNPILTNRHLGWKCNIVNVGHGDLVETQTGEWWMVVLASRPYGGYYRNLGRETFLVPVEWQDGWPVVCPGIGHVEETCTSPDLPEMKWPIQSACDHFDNSELNMCWNFIRTPPSEEFWSLTKRSGYLCLKLRPQMISKCENPSYVGRRQQHKSFTASTVMEFTPKKSNENAGLVLIQNEDFQYRFVQTLYGDESVIQIIKRESGNETIIAQKAISFGRLYLKIEAVEQEYNFYYATSPQNWIMLLSNVDGRIISTDVACSFTGAYIGMYASSNNQASENFADFDWFEYLGFQC